MWLDYRTAAWSGAGLFCCSALKKGIAIVEIRAHSELVSKKFIAFFNRETTGGYL
jgi:hypothetical protein